MIKKFLKKLIHIIWTFSLQDYWKAIWSKTSVDEKAIATLKEVQKRYKLSVQEIEDVAAAMKEVANQIDDIPGALKGNGRKGRKTKK